MASNCTQSVEDDKEASCRPPRKSLNILEFFKGTPDEVTNVSFVLLLMQFSKPFYLAKFIKLIVFFSF